MLFNKTVLLSLLAFAAADYPILGATKHTKDALQTGTAMQRFEVWLSSHGKIYESAEEKERRMQIWMQTDREINDHNAQGLSWTKGHNEWSDWTQEEWESYFHLDTPMVSGNPLVGEFEDVVSFDNQASQYLRSHTGGKKVTAVQKDWKAEGCVTPVKFQGACGSCWAFGATASMESEHCMAGFGIVDMSEQELIDCDHNDNGCQGGFYATAWKYEFQEEGVCSEESYPYEGQEGECRNTECTYVPNSKFTKFKYGTKKSVDGMKADLMNNPLVVAVDSNDFKNYSSGVYDGPCGDQLTHAMFVYGYDDTAGAYGDGFFMLKNSWGTGWGEEGFMKIAYKNGETGNGKCGMLMYPAYALKPTR